MTEEVVSDNGPQFSSRTIQNFSREYCFEHITSSPLYPQSNGEAEWAVRTVKSLWKNPLKSVTVQLNSSCVGDSEPLCLWLKNRVPKLPDPTVLSNKNDQVKGRQK